MRYNAIETIMAAVVLVVAVFFLLFAVSRGRVAPVQGAYAVSAEFSNAGGIEAGADVRIHGVTVGRVSAVSIDPKTLIAQVSMSIDPSIRLPVDTKASIATKSALGGKIVDLTPGKSRQTVGSGGHLTRTRAYVPLEEWVGKEVFQTGLGGRP